VDFKYLNKEYTQIGNVCATASYGIIVEYFSQSKYPLTKFFTEYLNRHNLNDFKKIAEIAKGGSKVVRKFREDKIDEHFHNYCRTNDDKRGFEYIVELHNENFFQTNSYCEVIRYNAKKILLDKDEIQSLREELKKGGLAMVLYQVTAGLLHSVVVGYDVQRGDYFMRDPNKNEIIYEDILLTKEITEYILFNGK
jgi:hypothetical protein